MKLHHVAIVVEDLDAALQVYQQALGLELAGRRAVPAEGVEIAFLPTGEAELELMRPLDPENSIGQFLAKRGEGIHHICLLVEDIEAAVQHLQAAGARMATEIRSHPDGTRYAFVHPKSTRGVLIELYQKPQA